ncbi:MAG: hypothetical protein H0U53_01710 [Actinobacteria bacterium]|nr:hypothetical protein [Actinomycetota bacterium]
MTIALMGYAIDGSNSLACWKIFSEGFSKYRPRDQAGVVIAFFLRLRDNARDY